ncbi:receptor-type tyrosine-protein phosphatase C [Clarias gariepinus]|uniref:receptor-type tyrosine-protein phosphatase C n=1 Tax=Clarias gariepinus TaxID=13013 RepID=UPI00234DE87A|nr:receptor-type tyrosine-protein phosphatase C [Clarias gariepinus]
MNKTVEANKTTGLPTIIPTPQHQPNTIVKETVEANKTGDLAASTFTPRLQTNTTVNKTVEAINTSGSPTSIPTPQHQTNTTVKETDSKTSGSPTIIPTPQHQTNTTVKETVLVEANITSGLPTSTPTPQHQTNTTVKETVLVNNTSGSPATTPTQQHQTNTNVNKTVLVNNTSGSPAITPTQPLSSNTSVNKTVTDSNTSRLPTIITTLQHQTNTTVNKTVLVAANNTSGLPTSIPTPQHQTNTTVKETDSKTSGSPTIIPTPQHPPNTTVNKTVLVEANNTAGLPTSTPTPQHQTNTTVKETVTDSKTSGLLTIIPTPQHQPKTNVNKTVTDSKTSGSPTIIPTPQHQTNTTVKETVEENKTTGLPTITPTPQHQPNTIVKETVLVNNTSGSPAITPTQPLSSNTSVNKTVEANETSGLPASTPTPQHQTNTTVKETGLVSNISGSPAITPVQPLPSNTSVNKTVLVEANKTGGLPTSTPTPQHQTNTTVKETVTGSKTSGSPATTPTQPLSSSTSVNKTVRDSNTSGLPTIITTLQHQTNTNMNKTVEANETRDLRTSTFTPQHQPNTTVNKTVTDSKTSGSPTIIPTPQHQTNTTVKETVLVEAINTSGSPTSTPTPQHQTNTTVKETVTDSKTSGLLTIIPTPQHQPKTNVNKTVTDSKTTGSPTIIPTPQHQTNTTVKETVLVSNTSGSPATTPTQPLSSNTSVNKTENLNLSTPDSTLTTLNTTPTLPTRMPTTTGKTPKCNLTLDVVNYQVRVKLDNEDTGNYDITFTNALNNSDEVKKRSPVAFKLLKPCQNYNVTVNPYCELVTGGYFKTPEFDSSTVTSELMTEKGELCFYEKIWDLNKCIKYKSEGFCANNSVTFDFCHKPINFRNPPVKPVIKYTNNFPPTFNWTNKPSTCHDCLKYSCNGSTDLKNFIPLHDYECKGIYDYYLNENVTSDPIPVKYNCDLKKPTISVNDTSIQASWDFTNTNCTDIINNLNWEINCNPPEGKVNQEDKIIKGLKPYKDYECTLTVMYDTKHTIHTDKTNIKTQSSRPPKEGTITKVNPIGNNAFEVKCEILEWNGKDGHIVVEYGPKPDKKNCTKKQCDIVLDNLYYLTTYTIKVYAINGNGNKTLIYEDNHDTKYNDKAVLGILSFLIIITSLALLFVLYKIYLLKKEKSRNEQELDDLLPTNALLQVEPMSAEALLEAYKRKRADEGRLFMEEFQSIPRIFSNYTVREAKKPENQPKNRYVDILPYDYNRVSLSHGGTDDYINASFIEGYKESNKYIAAQGPKEETVGEFWTMIWEQKSSIIVMVTRCEEGNKNKCAQYWPSLERETEIFEDLVVKIKGEETCPDYIIRHLTLMNRKEKSAEREVTHIQFTSWPDHGVPSDPGLLLKLRRRVNSFKNFFSGPIVIHCSAGVGRTGTYIGIDAMIESLEAEGRVDIYGYVVKLRRQRCLMVQVEAQYVLIHTALIEYSQFGETEMPLSNFHSEVNILRQKEGSDQSLIEMEFQKLPKFKNYRSANTARSEENKNKNRSSIVPYDFNRVPIKVNDEASHDSEAEDEDEYSSDEDDEIPTKYINASYVDGYWSSGSFIAAQGPMPDTVVDFLHMLYQKRVKTVFMLTDCTENEKEFCSQYWDDEKKTFGELEVEVKETENCPTYVKRCLEIQHTKRKDSHTLEQYHFLKWAGHELPPNPLDLVEMMRKVRQDSDTKNSDVPIVVHCNDGSSRSGVFCALWKLLDAADTEKLVDVFQVAKDLRKARLGVINSVDQYDFLYGALEAAYPIQNGEVKKPAEPTEDTVQVINESTALISPSTDAASKEESPKESTDPPPPEEGATEAEASSEPEKTPSENTTNGPTATIEV